MLEINKIYKVNSTAVMQTHANPSQGGQTSVVAHHRAFSQPTVVGSSNLVSTNDPWCLQSTGHQMAPTAPLRVNKRPAPQPVNTASAISKEVDGSVSNLQMQQSHAHSMVPTTSLHVHNVNQIHGSHAASHLTPHGSSSETITTVTNNANNLVMNNQQQQQQMLTFCPQGAVSGVQVNNVAHVSKTANNLMAASLTLHERGLPHKSTTLGSGMQQTGSSQTILQQQQQSLPIAASLCSSTMSTSLHSFDKNCTSSNPSTVSTWGVSANPSSASTPNMPCLTNQLPHSSLHNSKAANVSHRKCDVQLNAMPWFHGSITRDEAEHLLNPREDGLFLVRESTNFPGDYTLCVCFQGKVEHYRVKYLENQLTIDDEEYFENLWQLVAHYEADADGLCTQLIKCLPKAGAQQFCLNSKDFIDKGWVIPEADLQLRESIGKGEFGDVMLGILRSEKVAVKMLKDEGAVQKFLAEASVMTTLEHENLVKFIGLVFTSKHIYLVTEYMSKGSLVDYLRSRGRQHITKKDQINFAYDTASGMEYLEAKKVVHRDLAARNVLISEECVAKVSDFGLARGECYNLDVGKLPIKWTAPEALKNGRFSNKSDMWSFGILLWEIYSFGRVPYPRIPLNDVVKHVEVGYKMEAPEGCPAEIYEMMRQAWDLNPLKRPSFAELKIKLLHLKNSTS